MKTEWNNVIIFSIFQTTIFAPVLRRNKRDSDSSGDSSEEMISLRYRYRNNRQPKVRQHGRDMLALLTLLLRGTSNLEVIDHLKNDPLDAPRTTYQGQIEIFLITKNFCFEKRKVVLAGRNRPEVNRQMARASQ